MTVVFIYLNYLGFMLCILIFEGIMKRLWFLEMIMLFALYLVMVYMLMFNAKTAMVTHV